MLLDHTIRNAGYVAKSLSLPCLGSFAAKTAKEDDELRRLRAAVTRQVGESGSILFAPVKGKRGAGRIAAGLGRALTMAGRTVLLLEEDFPGRSRPFCPLLKKAANRPAPFSSAFSAIICGKPEPIFSISIF